MSELAQYPIIVATLIYVIKTMVDYIKELKKDKNKDNTAGMSENFKNEFYEMTREVKDIHNWLRKEDNDGKKLIYMSSSFENVFKEFGELLKENTLVLKSLQTTIVNIENS